MTAKELFESFGFKQTTNNDNLIEYNGYILENGDYLYITFYRNWKYYEVGYSNIHQIKTERSVFLTIKEHEIITQQMKELGWI